MREDVLMRASVACAALAALLLAGCGGGGGSSSAPPLSGSPSVPTPTPTPPGPSTQTVITEAGAVNGTSGQFSPSEGDTSSGGNGAAIDGMSCYPSMSDNYHIHVFVGLYVNGTADALPAAIGMASPGPSQNGFIDTAGCFYTVHTHDASGIVHIEDADPTGAPITQSLYTLQSLFDVWGISVNGNQFGPFAGPVRVFTSGQVYRGDVSTVSADDLSLWSGDPNAIPLYSHEVIYFEVGPIYPTTLPNVHFYLQY